MTETKIAKILRERKISQAEFRRQINEKAGVDIGADRVSKICTGRLQNYSLYTARILAHTLNVSIDEIVEF